MNNNFYIFNNPEIEKAILNLILLDNTIINLVVSELPSEKYFYNSTYRTIYKTILEFYKENKSIDTLILANFLENKIKDILVILTEIVTNSNASFVFLQNYINILKDFYLKREIKKLLLIIDEKLKDKNIKSDFLLNEIYNNYKNLINNVEINNDYYLINNILENEIEVLLKKQSNNITGIKTNFDKLDNILNGFHSSDFIIIASRPSIGKTSFALSLSLNILKQNYPVCFFSLEMTKSQIINRLITQLTKINFFKIQSGNLSQTELQRIILAYEELSKYPFLIVDKSNIDLFKMISIARLLKQKYDIKVIFIDYLQLININKKYNLNYEKITEISNTLKLLAKELDLTIIALSQLNRMVELRKPPIPKLSDLRESGSIEQDADVVLLLYRDEYYNKENSTQKNIASILIEKHRNGMIGQVDLYFDKEYMSFSNLYEDIPDNPFNS